MLYYQEDENCLFVCPSFYYVFMVLICYVSQG